MNKRKYKKALKKVLAGKKLNKKEDLGFNYMEALNELKASRKSSLCFCIDTDSGEIYKIPVHQQIFDICFNVDGTKKEENL